MVLEDFIEYAKQYAELGWAVQEQLDDLLNGDIDGLNPNAVTMIQRFAQKIEVHVDGVEELQSQIRFYWQDNEDEQ